VAVGALTYLAVTVLYVGLRAAGGVRRRAQHPVSGREPVRRVAFVDAYPHVVAGAQLATLTLARHLAAREVETRVVLPADGPFAAALAAAGVDHQVVPLPGPLQRFGRSAASTPARQAALAAALPVGWARLARALAWADVVHVNDHRGVALVGPGALAVRRPLVWHVHGIVASRLINAAAGRLARGVIVPTAAAVSRLPGLPARVPVAIVPNGRPVSDVGPPRAPGRLPTVATVGRLHPDKGVDLLLRAVALARATVPDLRLVVVGGAQAGSAGHADELRALAAELGIAGAVTFTGADDRPFARLAEAGATLYVGAARERSELLPLAVIEAMAAGYPVLYTDVGGVADLVRPGTTGRLVAPDRPPAFAAALVELLGDPAELDRLGAGARALVRAEHTEATMVEHLVTAYRRFGLDLA